MKIRTPQDLSKHLEEKHNITTFSTYLKEIVYGGNDGIITTFAVVAGFAGAQSSPTLSQIPAVAVILFGLANLFADGTSMALGNFLSIRADQDFYRGERQLEKHEIKHYPQSEFEETVVILKEHGYSAKDALAMTKLYAKNPSYWTEFMMRDELNLQNPEGDNPFLSGLATFIAFVFFGFIPLVPYLFFPKQSNHFLLSVAFTCLALLLLGIMRFKVTKINLTRSLAEVLALGGIAAVVAYFVGTFFRT
jgi:VIT1/CCC1 family predicted Fe2+/Mn2+ transporter